MLAIQWASASGNSGLQVDRKVEAGIRIKSDGHEEAPPRGGTEAGHSASLAVRDPASAPGKNSGGWVGFGWEPDLRGCTIPSPGCWWSDWPEHGHTSPRGFGARTCRAKPAPVTTRGAGGGAGCASAGRLCAARGGCATLGRWRACSCRRKEDPECHVASSCGVRLLPDSPPQV